MTEPIIQPIIEDSLIKLPEMIRSSGIKARRAMIVGDSNTLPLFGSLIRNSISDSFQEVYLYAFPAGECHKTMDSIMNLCGALIDKGFDRKDCILAIGGGVVGDMAGFASAIYLRGIDCIQLPTTLLAQIDSSIGGKTAVDYNGYKNMIGAFHMPVFVYTNPAFLSELPDEQFQAGMGEVIKSALLADADFYVWLKENAQSIRSRDTAVLTEMIRRTAQIKVDIVRRDPTEKGERALLNLGHTIGHAIEKCMNFTMIHGDCVAVGLIAAAKLSFEREMISEKEYNDIKEACCMFGLPVSVSGIDVNDVLKTTKSDKKMAAGHIRFILLESTGHAVIADDVTDEELLSAISSVITEA